MTQARTLFGDRALPSPRDEISARLLVGGLGELITAWLQFETSASIDDIVDEATRWFTVGMHACQPTRSSPPPGSADWPHRRAALRGGARPEYPSRTAFT